MPDNENVIFGAEFDSSRYRKGAQEIVESLQQIKAEQDKLIVGIEQLKAANKDLETSQVSLASKSQKLKEESAALAKVNKGLAEDMKFQQAEIERVNKAKEKLTGTTKAERTAKAQLSQQEKTLKADLQATAAQIVKNDAAILNNTKQINANKAAIVDNSRAVKENVAAIKVNEAEIRKNNATIAQTNKALDGMQKSSNAAVAGVKGLYGGLRTLANILPGLGIAGLIGIIYEFGEKAVEALLKTDNALSDLQRRQQLSLDLSTKVAEGAGKEMAQLQLLNAVLTSETASRKERNDALKKAQELFPEQYKNLTLETATVKALADAYEKAAKMIYAKATANAAESIIGENITKELKRRAEFQKDEAERAKSEAEELDNTRILLRAQANAEQVAQQQADANRRAAKKRSDDFGNEISALRKNTQDLQKVALDAYAEITKLGGNAFDDKNKDAKGPENIFRQKLAELRVRLAEAQNKEFQSEPIIQTKFKEQLDKEFLEISKLLKEKRLTGPQADILRGLIQQINSIDLSRSLEEFRKRQADALEKVNESIQAANVEAGTKRVANIRDEFEREKETIENSYQSTLEALRKRLADLTKGIDAEIKKGLISPETGAEKKSLLNAIFGDLVNQAEIAKTNQQLDLAFKVFQNTIKEAQRLTDEVLTGASEREAERVASLTEQYFKNAISYKKYQEELTKITREEARARNEIRLQELRDELAKVNAELATTTDATNRKKLEDQQRQIRGQIAAARNDINKSATAEDSADADARIKKLTEYANAINGVLASVVSFWNQVNQVEAAALDRSIALQQRRVDNAQEIADKGNAEYLEMEQKRMDDLERKREENARKQIAINNALTFSQATVAAISAIAQAASTGNPLAAIGALAATIGAIGAAFAFVNSLTPQSANFYEGSEYVEGKGRPRGKDTVPANLNIGERVITTDKNLAYWDTLTAIHNSTIPPSVLNDFVKHYPVYEVPSFDFGRLSDATNTKLGFDSLEVAGKLAETNEKLDLLIQVAGRQNVNFKLDKEGFAASVESFLGYQQKIKKA